jgi:type IV secretory pathway component VirB8
MQNLRDKLNNYSVTPPEGVWEDIAMKLNVEQPKRIIPLYKSKKTYYRLAAAASVIAAVACFVLYIFSNSAGKEVVSSGDSINNQKNEVVKNNDQSGHKAPDESLMRVPDKAYSYTVKNKDGVNAIAKNIAPQKQALEKKDNIKTKNTTDKSVIKGEGNAFYITIAGPEDQPVKVSAKVAALIESSDENVPPHTVWNKKINKWKDIMKSNTLAPTPTNFLDIVELNNTLIDKNQP